MNRPLFPTLCLVGSVLQGCMTTPDASVPPVPTTAPSQTGQTFLFSWGMYADPVFDRDVETFEQAYSRAFGTPAAAETFGFTSPRLAEPSVSNMRAALGQMAEAAQDGTDVIVAMLTSHGSQDLMAIKAEPNGDVGTVPVDYLVEFFAELDNDKQILILQSCFSGSMIDELSSPNRIILTAAAADRPSFGCNPDSDNTWFIKAINQAMVEVGSQGGSWQQVFERTQALVIIDEAENGVTASNPQSFVGANMNDVWVQATR